MIVIYPFSYALADNAYHTMLTEFNNHFILISGESGAGKTEASKKIQQYYAVSCHILNYLLEKSRVVHQNHGERNFHVFYQLVEGGSDDLLKQLGLERDVQHYYYLTQVYTTS
ncbi:hypothetical protein XENOCAPTIV_016274 [Xenoophorus captivus]|uniref:Myosin motor domain-containing protein n=1 Tax=Xenoophorus captivus TaxID=1517983 RepID=A0ABV0RZ04_9TELE